MNTPRIISILALCCFSHFAFGQQSIMRYVQMKASPVFSIEPTNKDFSDLEAIGKAIGDARIVMMGDQDHEDAPAFNAKARIIKYLHEQKGFNVIAFENAFFETNHNWEQVTSGRLNLDSFVKKYFSITWRSCTPSPLFQDYLPKTLISNNPLQIAGFDNVSATPYVLPLLDSVLNNLQVPITKSTKYATEILPMLKTWYQYTSDSAKTDNIIGYYQLIKAQLHEYLSEKDFWIATIDNLIAQNRQYRNWKKDIAKDRNVRDSQMAKNLKWLAQVKYPKEKIIVWAHNYHISKHSGNFSNGHFLNKFVAMGSVFTSDTIFKEQTYVIGFTSYKGTAGRSFERKYTVQEPKRNGFEKWISDKYDYAFVDFKQYNALYPNSDDVFYMKGSISAPYHTNIKAQWNRIFDGVFYIKDTYPLTEKFPCRDQ